MKTQQCLDCSNPLFIHFIKKKKNRKSTPVNQDRIPDTSTSIVRILREKVGCNSAFFNQISFKVLIDFKNNET